MLFTPNGATTYSVDEYSFQEYLLYLRFKKLSNSDCYIIVRHLGKMRVAQGEKSNLIKSIQTGCPFKEYRTYGEWFSVKGALKLHIDKLNLAI